MKQKAVNRQGKKIPVGIGIAMLYAMAVMLAGTLVLTWLLSTERIQEGAISYGVMIVLILSAGAASGAAIYHVRQNVLPVSVGTCFSLIIVLLGMNALFYDGNYDGVGATTIMILSTGIAVAMVALKYLNKPKTYHKKR